MLSCQIDSLESGKVNFSGVNDIIRIPVGLDGSLLQKRGSAELYDWHLRIFFSSHRSGFCKWKDRNNFFQAGNQIRINLPEQWRLVYVPSGTSGNRYVFVEKVIGDLSGTMSGYRDYAGRYSVIRRDGVQESCLYRSMDRASFR
jgi:hypothetical protein